MIQQRAYDRPVFLRVLNIEPDAWTQRGYRDEVALGFGLARPAHYNEYGEIDLYAVALTILITHFLKIDMRRAAELVRDYWRQWLDGLAKVERIKGLGGPITARTYSEGICFVVATNPDKTKIDAAVGPCWEVINEVGDANMVPFPLPLDVVVRQLRNAAKKAGVNLPKFLTPAAPDSDAYKAWIADVEGYRRFAATRRNIRKKAKETA